MNFSNRILVVDDTPEIHEDFRKILTPTAKSQRVEALDLLESFLFEEEQSQSKTELIEYRIDSAFQGDQAIEMVKSADKENDAYALIFMDVRMPPGINGVETIVRIWEDYPTVEIVIVSAYSDYTWEDILDRVGATDRLMFLRKPFDQVSVKQMTLSLTRKYNLNKHLRTQIQRIEQELKSRNTLITQMLGELKKLS